MLKQLKVKGMELRKNKLAGCTKKMLEIRKFEDKVHELFAQGVLPGFVHLYAGEEAVAVGVCAHLTDSDSITSTHRGHGHCIAKGCDLNGMMAELLGKRQGYVKVKAAPCTLLIQIKECLVQMALQVVVSRLLAAQH